MTKQEWIEKIEKKIKSPMSGCDLEILNICVALHLKEIEKIRERVKGLPVFGIGYSQGPTLSKNAVLLAITDER